MTSEQLFREIGNVDDDLVEEAEIYRREPSEFRLALVKWAAVAACLVLLAGLGVPRLLTRQVPQLTQAPQTRIGLDSPTPYTMRKVMFYGGNRYAFADNGAAYNFSQIKLEKQLGELSFDEPYNGGIPADFSANFAQGATLFEIPGYSPQFRIAALLDGEYYLAELVGKADDTPLEAAYYIQVSGLEKMVDRIDIMDHMGLQVLGSVDKEKDAKKMAATLAGAEAGEMTTEVYEDIAGAQAEGRSYQMVFALKDGTNIVMYIIPDMNMIAMGDSWYTLPGEFAEQFGGLFDGLENTPPPLM